MRGKIKRVKRNVWHIGTIEDEPKSNVHARRETLTFAILYDGNKVEINEDDIRNYYGCCYITENIIQSLNDDMHNKWIEYDEYEYLVGKLSDYI